VVDDKSGSVAPFGRRLFNCCRGASPDATFGTQNFRRLKSVLSFFVTDYGLKSVAWFGFGCVINYGLKPVAWFGFGYAINFGLKPVVWMAFAELTENGIKPIARGEKLGLLEHPHAEKTLVCNPLR